LRNKTGHASRTISKAVGACLEMFHVTERVMSTYHWIASGHKQFNEIIHGSEEKDSKLIYICERFRGPYWLTYFHTGHHSTSSINIYSMAPWPPLSC
jgi:hypothetical protein